jgi:hypothetical protein
MKLARWRNGQRRVAGDDGTTTTENPESVRGLGFRRDFHNLIQWMPRHRQINKF